MKVAMTDPPDSLTEEQRAQGRHHAGGRSRVWQPTGAGSQELEALPCDSHGTARQSRRPGLAQELPEIC
jgi:hypothetical protein